jgi:hypothetical protein
VWAFSFNFQIFKKMNPMGFAFTMGTLQRIIGYPDGSVTDHTKVLRPTCGQRKGGFRGVFEEFVGV